MLRSSLKHNFFFSSRRRHTRFDCDWSSDVCSSDLDLLQPAAAQVDEVEVEVARLGVPVIRREDDPLPVRMEIRREARARQVRHLPLARSEEHTSELQSQSNLVCRLLLEKKKTTNNTA